MLGWFIAGYAVPCLMAVAAATVAICSSRKRRQKIAFKVFKATLPLLISGGGLLAFMLASARLGLPALP